MTLVIENDRPVHYPANPDRFEFDEEVSQIFENMAERSIPMYRHVHAINAYLTAQDYRRFRTNYANKPYRVLDVGTSTGMFFKHLYRVFDVPTDQSLPGIELYALDPSKGMADKVRDKLPHVHVEQMGVEDVREMGLIFDTVAMTYVLQFIRPTFQRFVLLDLRTCLRQGGMLMLAQKESIVSEFARTFKNRYIEFRKANGYTEAEIEAKTKALENSMWTKTADQLEAELAYCGFRDVSETSRWLMFSSLVCRAKK